MTPTSAANRSLWAEFIVAAGPHAALGKTPDVSGPGFAHSLPLLQAAEVFREGAIVTLDAGCGNAALCYAAYQPGNPKGSISLYRQCVKRPKGGAASDPANQAR